MHIGNKKVKSAAVLAVCAIAAAMAVLIMTGIQAKYMTSVSLSGTVRFNAELADNVTLQEHKALRNADGSYSLNKSADTTISNTYIVMPGVDIEKDPYFTITNKSSIDAFLYVEIVDSSPDPDTVIYNLTTDWEKLDIQNRNVYVYKGVFQGNTQDIPILNNNMIYISDQYDPASENFNLKFYGYMVQKEVGKYAAGIFTENYPNVPIN